MASRFLFCPLASPGHVFPMVGISLELARRGHEVAFATSGKFSDLLQEQGLRRIPLGSRDGESFHLETWWEPTSIALQSGHIHFAVEEFHPDVLIGGQLTYGPIIMAEVLSLPVAILGFAAYLFPGTDEEVSNEADDRASWRLKSMLESFYRARKFLRLPDASSERAAGHLLGDLFLLQSVPELEPRATGMPQRVHCVGSCLWEPARPDEQLLNWLDDTRDIGPIIYVQHGRLFHLGTFWSTIVDCLGGTNVRVVASVGRMGGDEVVRSPSNFFVRDHVPQGQVLPLATAVIGTANTTAVLGALSYGLPLLLLPGGGEQLEVAAACERAGVAKLLDPETVTPDSFRATLSQIGKSGEFRASAQKIRSKFMKINGHSRASDLLESLAKRGVSRGARGGMGISGHVHPCGGS
ncbi:glycosyltransferase [Streptomyces eurythermus]|uniref:glycosyltransferase n=1 Tax=Streptomyces eurythermus TaxID=42237 RepID=UPI0036D36D62